MMTFLPTFIIARIVVYVGVPIFVFVRGTHIHHLTYGIILLAITGYLALTVQKPRRRLWVAGLYGVGLALAFDEFGMWLSLRDDYWVRWSYDVVLIIIALLINAVYFSDFWLRVLKQLKATCGQSSEGQNRFGKQSAEIENCV